MNAAGPWLQPGAGFIGKIRSVAPDRNPPGIKRPAPLDRHGTDDRYAGIPSREKDACAGIHHQIQGLWGVAGDGLGILWIHCAFHEPGHLNNNKKEPDLKQPF